MEWYWVVTIIVGFFAIVGALIWLGKKGKLTAPDVGFIAKMVDILNTVATMLAASTENKALDIMGMLMQIVNKAVQAAENDFYNKLITASERYANCMKYFDEMVATTGLALTQDQRKIVDTLIKAACEEMGHTLDVATLATEVPENVDLGVTKA